MKKRTRKEVRAIVEKILAMRNSPERPAFSEIAERLKRYGVTERMASYYYKQYSE